MQEFAKCYCLPEIFAIFFALSFFVIAYAFYLLLFFVLRKTVRKECVWLKLIKTLRYPSLWLFFEIAAVFSIHILNFPEDIAKIGVHVLNVLIIATLGWFTASALRAIYLHFVDTFGSIPSPDSAKRSMHTQILFFYRFLMFVIFVVTIAAILMTFPFIKNVGIGILGSAGIVGIALGIAARPILLNLMAGFQIAATKMIKIGDAVFVEGDFARIESIHLTHVVACTWDLRRLILPISYFIDKPFQNWDATNSELIGVIFLYCDYTVPVDAIRKKVEELAKQHPKWNKRMWKVQVTNCTEHTIEIRVLVSAGDPAAAFDLRADLREQLVAFLQREYPDSLPCVRNLQKQVE